MLIFTKCRPVNAPFKATPDSGAWDFCVPFDAPTICLEPQHGCNIPSGIKAIVPKGHVLVAYNKSSLGGQKLLIKTAELVDCDYIGEIHLSVVNTGTEPMYIKPGMPLVQFALHLIDNNPYMLVDQSMFDEIASKIPNERNVSKFGEATELYLRKQQNVMDADKVEMLKTDTKQLHIQI